MRRSNYASVAVAGRGRVRWPPLGHVVGARGRMLSATVDGLGPPASEQLGPCMDRDGTRKLLCKVHAPNQLRPDEARDPDRQQHRQGRKDVPGGCPVLGTYNLIHY